MIAYKKLNMSDPLIRECSDYVILEPGKGEQLLSEKETLLWLSRCLSQLDKLPADLSEYPDIMTAARRLLDTACDLELGQGVTVQWFAIRLEPPI